MRFPDSCRVDKQTPNVLDKRVAGDRQPDFVAIGSASPCALLQRHHLFAAVGIGVGTDHAKITGFELADHLRAYAHFELATMNARR
jgi:hypothetical protein